MSRATDSSSWAQPGMAALTHPDTAGVYKIPEDLLSLTPTERPSTADPSLKSPDLRLLHGRPAPGQLFDVYLEWVVDASRGWLVVSAAPDVYAASTRGEAGCIRSRAPLGRHPGETGVPSTLRRWLHSQQS